MTAGLIARLRPPGPVIDPTAAVATLEAIGAAATEQAWEALWAEAAPSLTPVFAASPYLASICRRWPGRLRAILETAPEARLAEILAQTLALEGGAEARKRPLRLLKAELHLLTALCDLAGAWSLDEVTAALSDFADATVRSALAAVSIDARERGRLLAADDTANPIPGLFCLAMGKHGAGELNYSSDIDVTFFHDPDPLRAVLSDREETQAFADRMAGAVARLLSERTGDGYVFRVDLRLRPDPGSTPPVVASPAALTYYETVGQNWERAAFIKARPIAGDLDGATRFLKALEPFIWRRSLDYGAVADIHSIKRQIHVHKVDDRPDAAGANLKLGRGGIREIEFFVQTQQLILGGRDPSLRSSRTLDALKALTRAGHVASAVCDELANAYVRLRDLEHRAQMLEDEQTHILPEDQARRSAVAALAGEGDLKAFDAAVSDLLARVNRRYGELFAGDEQLSSEYGSLVFTGVENDPETLQTLERMGFSSPAAVADTIRGWHHGRVAATRTARGREVFTRLAPRLLDACAATGAADAAFSRFAHFFERLRAGVQVQSLFLAQPNLFRLILETMAYSPRLAQTLARQASALDAIMDAAFFQPITDDSGIVGEIERQAAAAPDFEGAMNAVRRQHREQAFRISLQVLSGAADPVQAGEPFSDLAEACVRAMAGAAMREVERVGGAIDGHVAVVALGKLGSREMSGASDLDLMAVYEASADAASATRGWSPDVWYGRFTQRLIAALSAPTAEGGLYEVDMRLRPSGAAGPVAVSLAGVRDYYAREADTWEFMALTRGRVVWASETAFGDEVAATLEAVLRRPRDAEVTRHDAAAMRGLMARELPAWGVWDMKRSPGALIDCEFVAQTLQLLSAAQGGPLRQGTHAALTALAQAGLMDEADFDALSHGWTLHQSLAQLMRAALERRSDPGAEPSGFQRRLARLAEVEDLEALERLLLERRQAVRAVFERLVGPVATDRPPTAV